VYDWAQSSERAGRRDGQMHGLAEQHAGQRRHSDDGGQQQLDRGDAAATHRQTHGDRSLMVRGDYPIHRFEL
jgi:hypothetical protein